MTAQPWQTQATPMAQCGQTAQAKDATACQAMLANAAFQAACP